MLNKYYNAKIDVVLNGFVVKIGCVTVVAETPERLLELITKYLNDPIATEKELREKSISFEATGPVVAERAECSIGNEERREPTSSLRALGGERL